MTATASTERPLATGSPVRTRGDGDAAALAAALDRVLGEMNTLVETIGAAYRDDVAAYAAMPPQVFTGEILTAVRRLVTLFCAAAASARTPTTAEVRELADAGRGWPAMGLSLEDVLHAIRISGRVTWRAIVGAVRPGDEALLGELAAGWLDYIDAVSSAVAKSYVDASGERIRLLDARRRELMDSLLHAADQADVVSVGARHGVVLAQSYLPVVAAGRDGEWAAANLDRLLAACPAGTLGGMLPRGGRLLLLVPASPSDGLPVDAELAPTLAWAEAAAPGPDLLCAAGRAEGLFDTAAAHGRTGSFGPGDLLLEQLLGREPVIAASLHTATVGLLGAGEAGRVLTTTLRHWAGCGSIPACAKELVVHPNTIAYRLGRVRELTGLDPRIPAECAQLVLGLLVDSDPAARS